MQENYFGRNLNFNGNLNRVAQNIRLGIAGIDNVIHSIDATTCRCSIRKIAKLLNCF